MKITRLEIRGFGKFHNRNIELSEGINLFQGENETGKTTLFSFLESMLFDIERGRGRAAAGDMFHQYEPWDDPTQYGGMMQFEIDGKHFQIERDFTKNGRKTRLFCMDDGEELSEENGDFQAILSDLDRVGFENTIAIGQLSAEPGETLLASVKNYAANTSYSGNSDMDLNAAVSYLKYREKEVRKTIRETEEKRLGKREQGEQEARYIYRELQKLNEEYRSVKEEITGMKQTEHTEYTMEQKERFPFFSLFVIVVLSAAAIFFFVPRPMDYLIMTVVLAAEILFAWNRGKYRKHEKPKRETKELTKEKAEWKRARLQEEIREKQTAYENIKEQIGETYEIGEDEKLLKKREEALELAGNRLEQLSKEIYKDTGKMLNQKTSEILSKITDNVYDTVFIGNKTEISVFSNNRKIPAEKLSRGTIEQIYFSVRMAAAALLYEEEYPVILDDTFAYYDEKRLCAALRWLAENKKQVLLFSCHKREKEVLDRMHITYRDGWN